MNHAIFVIIALVLSGAAIADGYGTPFYVPNFLDIPNTASPVNRSAFGNGAANNRPVTSQSHTINSGQFGNSPSTNVFGWSRPVHCTTHTDAYGNSFTTCN